MRACVVVFGREPVAGKVKTRLARSLGPTRAARIYEELLHWTVDSARRTGLPLVLSLASGPSASWRAPDGVRVEVQPEGNLGERMLATFRRRFGEGFERTVIVGSDCPVLTPARLALGLAGLDRQPVVLGPAPDGGYWLIGQRRPGVDCFSGVPWSSSRTLGATRSRLRDLGIGWTEVDPLEDVDTVEDLDRVLLSPSLDPELRARLWRARGGGRSHPASPRDDDGRHVP